jgi:ElaA protein
VSIEVRRARALRRAVFVGEQGVALEEELDGRDGEALHLVAVDGGGSVVGTCRLLAEGPVVKLGRMAVAREARGQGIGARLLELADAETPAAERIVLAAQLPAIPLYERAGYVRRGDVFLDAGIEHVRMEKPRA